ncbi:hypothetical protein L596_009341 [Steinernema carpocapsae]|uniref:Uncharacterized protein n=1 Tax=Steinernema carpocapsae TaxID=34508 RepID=A0A4U5PF37_STECR|nr:hypothetical protein L596_009341 [Steinernema carpocapsae]
MFEDTKCRQCGEVVKYPLSRCHHVAAHLRLSSKCVIEGCEATCLDTYRLSSHLSKKRTKDLSERELWTHEKSKEEVNKLLKVVVTKFFPMKRNAGEDPD